MNKRKIIASTVTTIVIYLFFVGVCFTVDGTLKTAVMAGTIVTGITAAVLGIIRGLVFLWEWANKD